MINNDLQNTAQKTNDREGIVGSSSSTVDTRRVTLLQTTGDMSWMRKGPDCRLYQHISNQKNKY